MQITSPQFADLASGPIRPVSYDLRVSFTRQFDDSITFFTLDTSVLDGPDILAPSDDNPLQEWDKYEYENMRDRVMAMEVSREIEFPYSLASAVADFSFNNYDDLFTPNSGSYLSQYVLPSRPVRLLMGFNNENLQQFVGLTEFIPTIEDSSKTVSFHAIDFLSKLFTTNTPNIVALQNVTTDEVLAYLFEASGLLDTQYSLGKGRNKIAFLYYPKGSNMGEIIRRLMEAEMGQLWLDEQGIIRFAPRIYNQSDPVYSFDDSNIVDIKTVNAGRIINSIVISATIREVQESQPIFILSDTFSEDYVIPASSTKDIWINLQDPVTGVTTPTSGLSTTSSYFVATDLSGNSVGSVTVSDDQSFVDTYLVTFSNANAFPVRISQMSVWGTPAKIVDKIKYIDRVQSSIDKYEEQVLTIDNDFIQSIDACESIATTIFDTYSEYGGDIELSVKGTPALQIGDAIEVNKDTFTGDYRISSTTNRIVEGKFEQILVCSRYTDRTYFTLDQSLLDGTDVLTP